MGLNDEFGTVHWGIIQEEPVLRIKSVFARITKEEQLKFVARNSVVEDRITN